MSKIKEFRQILQQMLSLDVANAPDMKVLQLFYNRLCVGGFTPEVACKIAGVVRIDVCQEFVDNTALCSDAIEAVVSVIEKLYEAVEAISPGLFLERLPSNNIGIVFH